MRTCTITYTDGIEETIEFEVNQIAENCVLFDLGQEAVKGAQEVVEQEVCRSGSSKKQ